MQPLAARLEEGATALVPLADTHREGLRAACAADPEIWAIYPVNLNGQDFDREFDAILAHPTRIAFAVLSEGRVVGTTSYLSPAPDDSSVEIGGTYIAPAVRGTGFNGVMKRLMIDHAIACGYRRIEFRVDTRNKRSMAAVEKLGGRPEGVLRRNRVTWTGYVRDTAVFSILAEEWQG